MNLHDLQSSPATFRDHLRIDADGVAVRLKDNLDPWQNRDFMFLDDGWQAVVGQNHNHATLRAWLERPRGHSKTADIAIMATWALFASKRSLTGYAAAADKDQAKLLRDSIERIIRLNSWLSRILEVQQWRIFNKHTNSSLEILSSDAPTSYGLLPDFVIVDEITHWKKEDLWTSLLSSAAKRKNCMLVAIGNAGFTESWQFDLRKSIQDDDGWYFSRLNGPVASWITEDRLKEQEKLLPSIAFKRLWLNCWSAGSGDALSGDDIDRSVVLPGPLTESEPGWIYVAGCDLSLTKDNSAIVVIGKHIGHIESRRKIKKLSYAQRIRIDAGLMDEPEDEYHETIEPATGKIKVCDVKVWKPQPGRRISIDGIEKQLRRLNEKFHFVSIGVDAWQSAQLVERLNKTGIPTELVQFTGPNLMSMCNAVLESFSEGTIQLYNHPQLLSDLRNLRVVEKSYGVRLDSPKGTSISGHGDSATALSLSLHILKLSNNFVDNYRHDGNMIAY